MPAAIRSGMLWCQPMPLLEVCETLKSFGYRAGARMRLYGEELQITSEPYFEGEHIVVRATSTRAQNAERTVRIPIPIILMASNAKVA